ncbi:MAG: AsmA family protein [Planctomycetota bacterium]
MEGLLFFLAEFVKILSTAFVLLLIVLFLAPEFLALTLEIIIRLVIRHRKSPQLKKLLRFVRILALGCLGLFVLIMIILVILNSFYYETILRRILKRIEHKTNIKVEFQAAQGNLFKGVADMTNVTIVRKDHHLSNFDINADLLFVDLSMKHLVSKEAVFEEVILNKAQGKFERLRVPQKTGPLNIEISYKVGDKEATLPKRKFRVDQLIIEDANLAVTDRAYPDKEIKAAVEIDSLRTAPLLSHWPVYYLLFESRISGRLNGQPFGIERDSTESKNQSRWYARELPVEFMSAYIGGPLRWLEDGKVDLDVTSLWEQTQPDDQPDIEMNWSFIFKDIQAQVPAGAGRIESAIAKPVVAYFNEHADRLPISFGFTVNKGQFKGHASLEAVGLWREVKEAIIKKIAETIGVKEEELKEVIDGTVNKLKDLWQKFKQAK